MMNNAQPTSKHGLSGFTGRHPVLAVVLIEVILFLSLFAAGAYLTITEKTSHSPVPYAFVPIAILLLLYLLTGKRYTRYGFRSFGSIPRKELLFYLPLVADVLLVITNGLTNGFREISALHWIGLLGLALLVGFVEETVYRGLILNLMLQKGVRVAVLTSSLLFSLTHLLNLVGGQDLAATLLQLAYAFLVGLSLALLYIRHKTLLPLIAFHFLHNFTQFLVKEQASVLFDSLVVAALLVSCIWLLVQPHKEITTTATAA
jgi:membrane protease YdiL (CAAX protease family)